MSSSLLVCITGASGAIYGQRLVLAALDHFAPVNLVISARGAEVIAHELGFHVDLERLDPGGMLGAEDSKVRLWHPDDMNAPFASGSGVCDAAVIVPCSMGTAGRIASGTSDNLIVRAADVALKEGKTLILVPRETPLNLIHLRNLTTLAGAGAVVMPACPGFYERPTTVLELVDFMVARILLRLGVRQDGLRRWGDLARDWAESE
jgi:4-hydroxy-3-polyprenylbenzoate decarboxylase